MSCPRIVSSRFSLLAGFIHLQLRIALFLMFIALFAVLAAAQEPVPALPQVYIDTTWNPPTNGATWQVNSASTLQLVLNLAQPGDIVVLNNSATFSGNFTLPAKANPNHLWIYIESSGLSSLPPPGTRVSPSNAPNMAKVITPNVSPAFTLAPGANHYRLVGLEITSNSNQGGNPQNNPPSNNFTYCLVCWIPAIGLAEPDSITVDRSYVHGSPTQDVGQGVQCNASNCAVIDSYFSDIHEITVDSQAVLVFWSPGPIKIVDNYLSATTEDVMFGGAGGYNNPYVPSDIEIRNNHFFKPLAWDSCGVGGTVPAGGLLANGQTCPGGVNNQWAEKNNLEFKSAQRVIVTGNVMENTWVSAQTGSSVLFTIRTSQSGNNAVVDDITLETNELINVDQGFSTLEQDDQCNAQDGYPDCTNPGESKRIKIYDNLVLLRPSLDNYQHMGIKIDGGNAVNTGLTDYVFQHNTVLMSDQSPLWRSIYYQLPQLSWGCSPPANYSATHNLWILDNALNQQPDGDCGLVSLFGVTGLADYMGDPSPLAPRFFGNAIFATGRTYTYTSNNDVTTTPFTYVNPGGGDYQLLIPDWTDTTDGKVSGIDWASLQQASTVTLVSGVSSLYASQATTLTATVSVTGSSGAPTGTVNFMLGSTLLGTGTLTTIDGTDSAASMQLKGSQLIQGPNSITAVYSGDSNYSGSTSTAITVTLLASDDGFGTVNVGTPAPVQTLIYTFGSNAQLSAINILTMGVSGLDYKDGGSSTCHVGTQYTAGQSCTVTVAFTPSAPGLRAGSVTLFAQGTSLPLNTWYLSGTGESAAVTIDPGTQTTLGTITNAATYGSAIDGAGNVYVADNANGQVVMIAAGTKLQSMVVNQLSSPTSVALDGAGNLYIAESTGVVMVPNENGRLNTADMVMLQIAGLGLASGLAEDSNGDLYIADSATGDVIEVPGGWGTPVTLASGLTNPHAVAVDASGNVYVASDNQVNEYPVGGGTPIPMGTGYVSPHGVAVDASGTVYVADTGNAQIVKVAAGGESQSVLTVTGLVAPHGITVDATGDLYVSDSSSVYEVNRVQAAALNFGNVAVGTTSPAQTLQVSNIGNQQLTVSALAISPNFTQQASGGSDCSSTSQLVEGGGCAIAVAFSPTTTGVLNGTVTLTDNALNNVSSQQTVSLTGTGTQNQQPQTITFPNPGPQTYGAAPITLTATASSGLPVTYTVISGPATVSGSLLSIAGAGSVTVQANQAGNSQWQAAPPVNDTFLVNPAVLTVTANNASMTYGATLPAFTASYTGFVNGDGRGVLSGSPSLTTTATSSSPAGNYTITAAQGTLIARNYTFTFVNGTLTINQAVLTVTANNASMTYGGTLPAFTAGYTGFVNGDGQGVLSGAPSLTTTATSSSPAGVYTITASQGTLSAQNYSFVFVNGTLTILQAASATAATSSVSTLYASQATTLTATVSVTGLGGAPTGTVNFMLGSTLLGTGTLTMIDGTDSSASMQLKGSQLVLGPNSITAVYSGDNNYTGSTSAAITVTLLNSNVAFGAVTVGTPATVQTLTYTFSSNAQLTAINILTMGASGFDYQDGGSSTCAVATPYTAGQSCTVTVAFTPSAPGLRAGSVTLFAQGSNLPLNTWYLSGTGESAAVTIDPGTQTTLGTITNAATYGSAMDGAGNLYVADKTNGQVVMIAAGTQLQSVIVNQLSSPTSVALDGAGNLYIAESTGVVMVPNENGTLNAADMAALQIAGLGLASGLAEDGNGDLYVADSRNGNVLEVPGDWGTPVTLASGLTHPHAVAVDSAGNVYVTSDNQVSEYPAGGGSPIPMGTGYRTPHGVAVDASGTVYVADTGNAQIVKVAAGGGSQSVLTVTGLVAPHGITVDATGNLYVSDSSSVYEVNRMQAAALNFGNVAVGTTSPAQTLQVSNIGNQQLTVTALAISANFTQQASGGSDCSSTSQLVEGGGCAIAVAFSPTTTGVANGTVGLTDNALNNTSSQQTVSLTGTGTQNQQPQTITFPNPGTQTYGVAPITLTATASSGLPVTYTVLSGPATVSGSLLTIVGAGTVTVQANQAGNSQWQAAPPVNDTFLVNPALLTVSANNLTRQYGQNNPTLTYTMTGFVNGDTQGTATSGAPSLSTSATTTSPVGNYAIVITQGTLTAQNYTFAFVNGTLTITQASTAISWTPQTYTIHAGEPLGQAGVMDATVVPSIPGTMAYSTAIHGHIVQLLRNMVLPVGVYPITASFTPQDRTDYETPPSVTQTITVIQ